MIDIIILVFLSLFVLYGFFTGFVKMTLNLLASFIAIIFSIKLYIPFYELFPFIGFGSEALGKVLAFIVVLSISSFFLSLAFKMMAKALKIITSLPVISFANRVSGASFGLVQGLFIIGAILFVLSYYSFLNPFLDSISSNSEVAPYIITLVYWLEPLVPEVLDNLQNNLIF